MRDLRPTALVGSIPVEWECTVCGKTFALGPMNARNINPKVVVFNQFLRHQCATKKSRPKPRGKAKGAAASGRRSED